jgi:hypothetical protein
MIDRRRQRFLKEMLGVPEGQEPGAEDAWKVAGMVVLILFVVIFAGEVAA